MKNLKVKTAILIAVLGATVFNSCNSDPVPEIKLEQFMYLSLMGAKEYPSIKKLDIGSSKDTLFNLSIAYGGTTNYDQGNITAEIAADKSLADAYNIENKTNYLPLPEGTYSFDKTSLTIANGSNASDIAKLSIKTRSINLAFEYILPVTVKSVSGSDLPLNEDLKTIYLVFQGNVDENPDIQNWTAVDASSVWQAGYEVAKVFDDNADTYWHSDLTGLPQWFSVDMKGYKRVSGFTWRNRKETNQLSIPKHIKIETSMDGTTWTEALDIPELPQSRMLQVLSLNAAVIAKYFKVTALSSWSGDPYTYVAEVGVYSGDEPEAEYDWEKTTWKVTSCSSEWNTLAQSVLDDNKNTVWHTDPSDATKNGMPQWLIVDMQKRRPAIKGIKIWNRQEDHGSEPKHIVFSVSDDQVNWTTILDLEEMSNAYDHELDYKTTESASGRYLKVNILSTWGSIDYTYFSELTPY
ncbi:MAG: discoidin domain-containing protein [Tannerella sp.]|jgi:hypothetical protein|nr:discoidin domain-containing protein [Tannerella sp.]